MTSGFLFFARYATFKVKCKPMNKTSIDIVVGATGGIGEEFTKILAREAVRPVICLVRRLEDARKLFADFPTVEPVYCADLTDQEVVDACISDLASKGYVPVRVFLAAGSFKWDNDSRKQNYPSVAEIADMLDKANFMTKDTVQKALKKVFPTDIKGMTVLFLGSQAANFAEDDERRVNRTTGFKEEGYVISMQKVARLAHTLQEQVGKEDGFGRVILEEPGLIDTPMAREEFTPETIGNQIDWSTVVSPENYAKLVFAQHNLYQKAA